MDQGLLFLTIEVGTANLHSLHTNASFLFFFLLLSIQENIPYLGQLVTWGG